MAKSIPARWLPYQAIGESIPGTRFISFKVPLKEEICNKLASVDRFTPCMLVEKLTGRLGLVVDLTNTNRYYNPEEFKRMGVEHVKILCEGHKVPNTTVVAKFYAAVDDYLRGNPENDKLIGVHCTHGVNRTGYLICRYMIDKLGFQPDEAIDAFNNKARRHDMERQLYLDGLRLSAGDDVSTWNMIESRSCPTEGDVPQTKPSRNPQADQIQNSLASQRGTILQHKRHPQGSHGHHWRADNRPPPRPPARAGWHTPPSQPPQQYGGFGNHPGPSSGFRDQVRPRRDFYSSPVPANGLPSYQHTNIVNQNYSGFNSSFQNSGFTNHSRSDIGFSNYPSSNSGYSYCYQSNYSGYADSNSYQSSDYQSNYSGYADKNNYPSSDCQSNYSGYADRNSYPSSDCSNYHPYQDYQNKPLKTVFKPSSEARENRRRNLRHLS